jgi:2-keto-4-pentenoate hydratase/2-oxohepta-3-ene-1,7-dioic acid hydratase in catechol pathway
MPHSNIVLAGNLERSIVHLCSYSHDGSDIAAAWIDGQLVNLTSLARRIDPRLPGTVLGWVEAGNDAEQQIDVLLGQRSDSDLIEDVRDENFLPPITRLPYSAICLAANYEDHLEEALAAARSRGQQVNFKRSPYPCYFTKDPRTICGPFDPIAIDERYSVKVDWEVELVVVIGKGGRDIKPSSAADHIFGYATFNDVSVRDVQSGRCQMWKGKNLMRSSPFGPFIVTRSSMSDTNHLFLRCWVNGELMQDSCTSRMTYSIPDIIADLSSGFELAPGDIISTGTGTGTGNSRSPQRFLQPGDVLESEMEGLGKQRNPIVAYEP